MHIVVSLFPFETDQCICSHLKQNETEYLLKEWGVKSGVIKDLMFNSSVYNIRAIKVKKQQAVFSWC